MYPYKADVNDNKQMHCDYFRFTFTTHLLQLQDNVW